MKATARWAGLLYLLFSIVAIIGYMYIPSTFLVSGDAAATARKITEGALIYRLGILAALTGQILFLFLVLTLYQLFREVDQRLARLMVVLVCVGVAAEIANLSNRAAPLLLLSGADYLSVFTKPQLDALALGFIRLGNNLGQMLTAFWGLWLFPFGLLVIRSGYFPRILGILLMVAGVSYIGSCVTRIVFPAYVPMVSKILMPLHASELPIVFWLLVMGAKVPRAKAQSPQVA